jgi:hypothetical protein
LRIHLTADYAAGHCNDVAIATGRSHDGMTRLNYAAPCLVKVLQWHDVRDLDPGLR